VLVEEQPVVVVAHGEEGELDLGVLAGELLGEVFHGPDQAALGRLSVPGQSQL
jgi:hypothetical protein